MAGFNSMQNIDEEDELVEEPLNDNESGLNAPDKDSKSNKSEDDTSKVEKYPAILSNQGKRAIQHENSISNVGSLALIGVPPPLQNQILIFWKQIMIMTALLYARRFAEL